LNARTKKSPRKFALARRSSRSDDDVVYTFCILSAGKVAAPSPTKPVMIMSINDSFSASGGSLTALVLLADPLSTLLDRGRLASLAEIAFRPNQAITRGELAFLRECARHLKWLGRYARARRWLRATLKGMITLGYERAVVGAATTQRLIDRFELRSD
jgi:hypothetical protein